MHGFALIPDAPRNQPLKTGRCGRSSSIARIQSSSGGSFGSLGISAISRSRRRADSWRFRRSSSVSARNLPSGPKHDGGRGPRFNRSVRGLIIVETPVWHGSGDRVMIVIALFKKAIRPGIKSGQPTRLGSCQHHIRMGAHPVRAPGENTRAGLARPGAPQMRRAWLTRRRVAQSSQVAHHSCVADRGVSRRDHQLSAVLPSRSKIIRISAEMTALIGLASRLQCVSFCGFLLWLHVASTSLVRG